MSGISVPSGPNLLTPLKCSIYVKKLVENSNIKNKVGLRTLLDEFYRSKL